MSAIIKSKTEESVTIEVCIPLAKSMLECEENIKTELNNVGCLATKTSLEQFDTDGTPIMIGNKKWTSRGRFNKKYQTIWGEITVGRHTYQNSSGGKQFYPLERDARIILTATPGFAKLAASKYAEMGSGRALVDLKDNHKRTIARSYLKNLCDAIGSIAQAKEETWQYALPEFNAKVATIGVGIDGTCVLLSESGWRESMVGTLSLYDKNGTRLHTIQMGATPEYGKKKFYDRFDKEIEDLREKFPEAHFIGIADGAKSNWIYLKERTQDQIIDFWHATEYLGNASKAMFFGKRKEPIRKEWIDNACHELKNKKGAASTLLHEMITFKESNRLPKSRQEKLDAAITYYSNNSDRMNYHNNLTKNIPIGSGVTEAACKTLVKQRLCNSGMRWKEKGASCVLSLRSLSHTDCRWNQFWIKISQYGYPMPTKLK